MNILIRDAQPNDIPFIYSTWLRAYRYDSALGKTCRNTVFFEEYKRVLDRILQNKETNIKVLTAQDAQSTIFSYIVYDAASLHFAYTKEDFRGLGLVRRLVEGAFLPQKRPEITHLQPIHNINVCIKSNIQPGTVVAPPARLGPAIAHPLPANIEPSSNGIGWDPKIICTHKTFFSQKIFDNHPELLYNPFVLFKKGPQND